MGGQDEFQKISALVGAPNNQRRALSKNEIPNNTGF